MRKFSLLPLALLASLSLTACATAPSNGTLRECPPLKEYTKERAAKVADEVDAAPAGAEWPKFVGDYRDLRAMCKALLK